MSSSKSLAILCVLRGFERNLPYSILHSHSLGRRSWLLLLFQPLQLFLDVAHHFLKLVDPSLANDQARIARFISRLDDFGFDGCHQYRPVAANSIRRTQ